MAGQDFDKRLVGYLDALSVEAGDELAVKVSSERGGDYEAELVRLISGDSRPHGTGYVEQSVPADFAGTYPSRYQALQPGSYALLPDLPALTAFTFGCYVWPTLPDRPATVVSAPGFALRTVEGRVEVALGDTRVTSTIALRERRWHRVQVCHDGQQLTLAIWVRGEGAGESDREAATGVACEGQVAAGDWLLAAHREGSDIKPGFNGRIEAPRIISAAVDSAEARSLLDSAEPRHPALEGAWDFSREMSGSRLIDLSGYARHGQTVQTPTRAVRGVLWDGSVQSWQLAPRHYGAVHFHEDDYTDANWQTDFRWTIPRDLESGIYSVKLTQGGDLEHLPFFVRPAAGATRAPVAFLVPTASYLAYANQRIGLTEGPLGSSKIHTAEEAYLQLHRDVGYSMYEHHADGSGVHYSSHHRPVLNLKPRITPWGLTADTNISAWLTEIGEPFDVITDHDLHREGADLLAHYRVVITGTHPEYYSTAMLDGIEAWLGDGGRLMYMGGNGFYWRVAFAPNDPGLMEVRRAEDGTRAWIAEAGEYCHSFTGEYGGMWRRLNRAPNKLVGIGFAAQGFDGGTYYRLNADALDPRAAFILEGVQSSDMLGNYGTQGGGAAGEEIDRFDTRLGSPPHALVIATSENHRPGMLRVKEEFHMTRTLEGDPEVRADMTFFETPAGGAVFSTGSISYAGALSVNGYDNDIARLTGNVLRRFADAEPFDYPEG